MKRISWLTITTIVILTITASMILSLIFPFIIVRAEPSKDGKVLIKKWIGRGVPSVHAIIIKDKTTGQILGQWASVPPDGITKVEGLYHGQIIVVEWDDWRGHHREEIVIQCEGDDHLTINEIPYPPKSL